MVVSHIGMICVTLSLHKRLILQKVKGILRPLNSHGLTVRHTVLGLFSQSHGQILISHCQVQSLHCQPSTLTVTGFCTSLHE